MKIVSWGIIFVVVIFSFSFVNRTILNNKMDIMKEEVRYNNALTQATNDATQEISNQMNNGDTNVNESYQMVLSAVDKFFETFSLSTGYYGGNQKDSIMKMYVPAIAIMTYDGFYISSLENVENKLEHTLKPETGYIYDDTTDKYINFTLDNYVKTNKSVTIFDDQLQQNKTISEGYIVDLRHKDNIENATNDVYVEEDTATGGKYIGQEIRYEKSFYTMSHVRYLLEEWYQVTPVGETLINKRMTRYTEEDYKFTKKLEEKGYSDSIVKGNPENDGFIDPITGEYTIGTFNKIRRETITRQVTEKMQYYILLHNKFAQANGITYTFTLPEIKETDWENAIQDVSVFAFVQGISLLNQEYYNNYSFSGARIVDKEVYYGIPPEEDAANPFSDTNLPVYYSSRKISETNRYLFERNNARIFNSREDAADYGYYPNVNNSSAVADRVMRDVWDIKIDRSNFNCVVAGQTLNIVVKINSSTIINEVKWGKGIKNRTYFNSDGNVVDRSNFILTPTGTMITIQIPNVNNSSNYSIYVRDVDGTAKVEVTGSIDVISDTLSVGVTVSGNDAVISTNRNLNQIVEKRYVDKDGISKEIENDWIYDLKNGEYTVVVTDCTGDTQSKIFKIEVAPTKPNIVKYVDNVINNNMVILQGSSIKFVASSKDSNNNNITKYKWEHYFNSVWTTLTDIDNTLDAKSDYAEGTHFIRVTAIDDTGVESESNIVTFVIGEYTGNMMLDGPISEISVNAPSGLKIIGFKFIVPSTSSKSGNGRHNADDKGTVVLTATDGTTKTFSINTKNGVIMHTSNLTYTNDEYNKIFEIYNNGVINDLIEGSNHVVSNYVLDSSKKYTTIKMSYYTPPSHMCMYNKSNITYELLYDVLD